MKILGEEVEDRVYAVACGCTRGTPGGGRGPSLMATRARDHGYRRRGSGATPRSTFPHVRGRLSARGHAEKYKPRGAVPDPRYQADSISASSSARVGGSGVKASSGRRSIDVHGLGELGCGPRLARQVRADCRPVRGGGVRCCPGSVSRAVARGSRPSGARGAMKAIARGRMAALVAAWGAPQMRTRVWQTTWWMPKAAGVDRVAAEDRAEGEGAAVALGWGLRRGRWRSARRRAGRSSARPGWRRGCRGSRRRGRGRSSSWRAARARARWSSPLARRSPARAARVRSTRSSAPAGRRWMPVISAPDIVVGIAATRAPVTEAIALAVSIVRPPPRATRTRGARRVEQGRGGLRDRRGRVRGRHLVDGDRGAGQLVGAARGDAGSRAARSAPCRARRAAAEHRCTPLSRKTTTRPASRQTKLPLTRPRPCAG